MPTITKTFTYTGTTQVLELPPGTTSMNVTLWGGAGGGGGGDQAGGGRTGAAGHHVVATNVALTSYAGQTMRVAVGGGGGGGSAGGNAAGGANGRSLTGYSGGTGGTSGPRGSSGAGGGGGGATVITINGTEIAIAGGGGGGAGDGRNGTGTSGINSNSATTNSPTTLGENGANHTGDGGGGGAGGGGDVGGKGGSGGSGDVGGAGGHSGSNLLAGGSEDNGSGQTPGGTGLAAYQAGIAVGGNSGSTGGAGKAVIVFTISPEAYVKVGSAWKKITEIYFKAAGVWKKITGGYFKYDGSWKAIFNSGIEFEQTSAGFGDASGNPSSGTPGSGGGGGGGRVICTWLQNKGMFSLQDLQIDTEFSVNHLGRTTKIGYWFWAIPLVEYMQNSAETKSWFGGLVTDVIKVLAQARANELAYKMGKRSKGDILGKFTRWIGESFCFVVGLVVRPFVEHRFGKWLEIYDPEIR